MTNNNQLCEVNLVLMKFILVANKNLNDQAQRVLGT